MKISWSELQPELIEIIATKITRYIDYIRFRAVCMNWSSSLPPYPLHLPCQFPWLMLPSNSHSGTRRGFYNLSEKKIHHLYLPESLGTRCCGSSQGWVVLVEQDPNIFVLNPLTRTQIQLPPLTTFPNNLNFNMGRRNLHHLHDFFIKKVVLSSISSSIHENNEDLIAVAILTQTGELAFCKKGGDSWILIEDIAEGYCLDITFYNDLFYAINRNGSVTICDFNGGSGSDSDSGPLVKIIEPPLPVLDATILYLVASFDELLLVTRHVDILDEPELDTFLHKTTRFHVFRLDSSELEWVKVTNLRECILFLSANSSSCLLASDVSNGFERNCIYFTDDYFEASDEGIPTYDMVLVNNDMGMYNLGTGSFKPLPYCTGKYRLLWPTPTWFVPNPC